MKTPWKDKRFALLDPCLKIAYLYLRTNPWPLPGVFCLPKKLPIEFISTNEINQLVDLQIVFREADMVYVPGCIPGLPDTRRKVASLCARYEALAACEPRRLWTEELRGFYEERRGHSTEATRYLGRMLFGEKERVPDLAARDAAVRIAEYFKLKFEALHSKTYVLSIASDIKAIIEVLKSIDEDEIIGRIDSFLVSDWYVSKNLLRLNVFCRNVNQFGVAKQWGNDLSGYRRFIDRIA